MGILKLKKAVIQCSFILAKTWKQTPKCPLTGERIRKDIVHIHREYSAIEKNEMMSFSATWMDLDIVLVVK